MTTLEPERRDDNPLAYQAWLNTIYGDAYEEAYPPYDPDTDDDGEGDDE